MNFKSDSQRKAVMSKFSLYNRKGFIRSTDYPGVDVELIGAGSRYLRNLSDIPEQHLSGIRSIEVFPDLDYNDYEGVYVEENFRKNAMNDTVKHKKPMTASLLQFVDSDKTEPYIEVNKTIKDDVYPIVHEVGHHIERNSGLSTKNPIVSSSTIREMRADNYASSLLKDDEFDESMSFATALQELKNPSIGKQMKDSGVKFSFWERKNKGWYPADSKLPDEFPTIVRNVAFGVLGKDPTYITPDDDAQLTKLTGNVCSELDKVWKPEWGTRPSGHYLRADVKDAWEDLD